jgi:hypothetical protein
VISIMNPAMAALGVRLPPYHMASSRLQELDRLVYIEGGVIDC